MKITSTDSLVTFFFDILTVNIGPLEGTRPTINLHFGEGGGSQYFSKNYKCKHCSTTVFMDNFCEYDKLMPLHQFY